MKYGDYLHCMNKYLPHYQLLHLYTVSSGTWGTSSRSSQFDCQTETEDWDACRLGGEGQQAGTADCIVLVVYLYWTDAPLIDLYTDW